MNKGSLLLTNWSIETLLQNLATTGAAKLKLLTKKTTALITQATLDLPFVERQKEYGPRKVRQNFSACENDQIPKTHILADVSQELTLLFHQKLTGYWPYPFSNPLKFNDLLLLHYPASQLGLGAHRDHSQYINLIVSLTLLGEAQLNIHREPNESPSNTFRATAGSAIFMVAPGCFRTNHRPVHSVTSINKERLALILKQK